MPWAMTASTLVQNAQVGNVGAQIVNAEQLFASKWVVAPYVESPGITVQNNQAPGKALLYVGGTRT